MKRGITKNSDDFLHSVKLFEGECLKFQGEQLCPFQFASFRNRDQLLKIRLLKEQTPSFKSKNSIAEGLCRPGKQMESHNFVNAKKQKNGSVPINSMFLFSFFFS